MTLPNELQVKFSRKYKLFSFLQLFCGVELSPETVKTSILQNNEDHLTSQVRQKFLKLTKPFELIA